MKKLLLIFFLLFFNHHTNAKEKYAYFAGGCFWCMEPAFDKLTGVINVVSGYSGGHVQNPTYQQVVAGKTGHIETVKITYNSEIISYLDLLKIFWVNIDPYDGTGQFCDRGKSYASAIFYLNKEEKDLIDRSILEVKSLKSSRVKTVFAEFKNFYPAEEYHQKYYQKNPSQYFSYVRACGRIERLKEIWN